MANRPLAPPHRRHKWAAWAGANDDPEKDVEAMMPKDILKFATKVDNIEEAILQELKKREDRERQYSRSPQLQMQLAWPQLAQMQSWQPGSLQDWHQQKSPYS
jgi:hypothetical protein